MEEKAAAFMKTYTRARNTKHLTKSVNREERNTQTLSERTTKENRTKDNSRNNSKKGKTGRKSSGAMATSASSFEKPKQNRDRRTSKSGDTENQREHTEDSSYQSLLMDPLFGEELNVPKCRKDRKVEMADTESCLSEKDPKGSAEKQKTVSRLTQENVEILQKECVANHGEKVTEWLNRSHSSDDLHASIEVFRGEQRVTAEERRAKLFPDDFFTNMARITQNRGKQARKSAEINEHVAEKQKMFLQELGLSLQPNDPSMKTVRDKTTELTGENYNDFVEVIEIPADTNSDRITGTKSTARFSSLETELYTATMETDTVATRTGAISSKGSVSQSLVGTDNCVLPTAPSSAGIEMILDTLSTRSEGAKASVPIQSSEMLIENDMSENQNKKMSERASKYTRRSSGKLSKSQCDIPARNTEGYQHSSSKDSKWRTARQESDLTSDIAPRRQNYLTSTWRRSSSGGEFPSELSNISMTDSLKKKSLEEKTPNRPTEFKLPRSPIKVSQPTQRQGHLEQKNSTQLFTTGFVEISDAFPQLSSIRPDTGKILEALPKDIKENEATEVPVRKVAIAAPVKTSTPNRTPNSGPNFDFDLSSVKEDTDEDELLCFNTSGNEVNSSELIDLSNTLIAPEQECLSDKNVKDGCAVRSPLLAKPMNWRQKMQKSKNLKKKFPPKDVETKVPETKTPVKRQKTLPSRNQSSVREIDTAKGKQKTKSVRAGLQRKLSNEMAAACFRNENKSEVIRVCHKLGIKYYNKDVLGICPLTYSLFRCEKVTVPVFSYKKPLQMPECGYIPKDNLP